MLHFGDYTSEKLFCQFLFQVVNRMLEVVVPGLALIGLQVCQAFFIAAFCRCVVSRSFLHTGLIFQSTVQQTMTRSVVQIILSDLASE